MAADALAPLIPVAAIVVWGAVKMAKIKAQGAELRFHRVETRVRLRIGALRQELGEVHERLDFTERLLAQQTPTRLDGPK